MARHRRTPNHENPQTEVDRGESTPELEAGWAAAAELAQQDWQLEAEPDLSEELVPLSLAPDVEAAAAEADQSPAQHDKAGPTLFPLRPPEQAETPPLPRQIIEAMLFVGGTPLTAARASEAIRGLTYEQFQECINELARQYRQQLRPYSVVRREEGYVLAIQPRFRAIQERLFGGPRSVRLSQAALDVLSLIAYKQPLTKAEVDSLRGADSGGILRLLVRLGLAAVGRRQEADRGTVCYRTTPRFLETFGLNTLEDLPRLAE